METTATVKGQIVIPSALRRKFGIKVGTRIQLEADEKNGCIEADWNLTRAAAAFKATLKMSFADCFAAALAKREKAELVTGAREFKQVEAEVRIAFLGRD